MLLSRLSFFAAMQVFTEVETLKYFFYTDVSFYIFFPLFPLSTVLL